MPSARARDRVAIAVPSLIAAALSVYDLTGRSLGFDEGATVAISSQHGAALGSAIAHDGGNMSAYYLVMHVLIGVFGDGLVVLRLPSVLATAAAVALVGVIAIRLFDRRVAWLAGLLTAVSLPLVYWAQTGRGYAPMLAFVCAGFIAFISLADPASPAPVRRRAWVAYVVLMTLATYMSFVAVLVVVPQVLALMRRRDAARRLAGALVAITVACLPLVILAARRGSGQLFWVPRPMWEIERQVLESLTSSGLQPSFHRTATTVLLMVITLTGLLVVVIAVAVGHRRGEAVWPESMTVGWFAVPVLLTFVYSLLFQPLFLPRNLLTCIPAAALLLARLLTDRRLPRMLAAGAVIGLLGLRVLQLTASYGVSPEPWQAASTHVLANARAGDCIAFYPEDARMAFQYYVGTAAAAVARAPRSILPVSRWGLVRPFVEDYVTLTPSQLASRSHGCRRLWLVSSHEGQVNGPVQSRRHRARYLRLDAELERAFGDAPIERYGYASTIHVQLLPGPGRH
jgi:mannosyltransferase